MQCTPSKLLETIGNHVNLMQSIIKKRDWFSWHISTTDYLAFVVLYIIIQPLISLLMIVIWIFNIIFIVFVYNNEYSCIFIHAYVMDMLQMNVLYEYICDHCTKSVSDALTFPLQIPQESALS